MNPSDERSWEVELLDEAEQATYGDFAHIRTVCRMMFDDLVADGYPEHIARRHTQRVMDEYFESLTQSIVNQRGGTDAHPPH